MKNFFLYVVELVYNNGVKKLTLTQLLFPIKRYRLSKVNNSLQRQP